MTRYFLFPFSILLLQLYACAQVSIPQEEAQLGGAVMAAPADQREGATILGYNSAGEVVTLRKGTNKMVCLADNPMEKGYSCACYHQDLEPFMARGRELYAQGKDQAEVFDIREKEAKEGSLKMPEQPTTLHILSGPAGQYNPETGQVDNANYRYVVYIPWATAESTGLPLKPMVPGAPWIMDPGTHRAHIMISPPPPAKN
jgi:hypothetical protein